MPRSRARLKEVLGHELDPHALLDVAAEANARAVAEVARLEVRNADLRRVVVDLVATVQALEDLTGSEQATLRRAHELLEESNDPRGGVPHVGAEPEHVQAEDEEPEAEQAA